ncbi:S-adenosyl-L-methionine-dependent methyltransferase [Xylariales sp. AK1849]|nr:S-adenosyl-L-methionine-dependent methyltransferase [Xylariales sp. AK1849]
MSTQTNTGGNPHLVRAYDLSSVDEARKLYDEWAATYDGDMADVSQDYVAPALAAQSVQRHITAGHLADARILDAGCGTGHVGVALSKLGARTVDGLDLSPGMLEFARKTGVYGTLKPADLSQPLVNISEASYDVIVCVGTLTHGHVGPAALREFTRVLSPGGIVVATVLTTIWESGGYAAEVKQLTSKGEVQLLSKDEQDYRKGADVSARMIVLKRVSHQLRREL